ncbi:hypothetical protein ACHAP5_000100 [Fusarium lateritium]
MASCEISQHPVLKEFKNFISCVPSLDDKPSKFTHCLGWAKGEGRRCHNPNAEAKHENAENLWETFKRKEKYPYDLSFYEDIESFLEIVHCGWHVKLARSLFNNWKQHRVDNSSCTSFPSTAPDASLVDHDILPPLSPFVEDDTPWTPGKRSSFSLSYVSDEASLPGTPDSDRVFESPNACDITPFSSPLTAYYTPQAMKTGSSGSDGFFFSPSRRLFESPSSFVNEENSTTDYDQNVTSTLAISATPTTVDAPGDIDRPSVVVETITEINTITSQEPSKELPIMIKKEVNIEETTTKVSIAQANAPVPGNPLVDSVVGKRSCKRKGTVRGDGPFLVKLYDYLTATQLKEGVVYVLQHSKHEDIFKIGFSEHSANKRLEQPGNCYRDLYNIVYESKRLIAAQKAEALAQVSLRRMNLDIIECYECGSAHRELFQGPKEEILKTVQDMESFVRGGSYERHEDGKWKLSDEADKNVSNMVNLLLKGLLVSEESQEEPKNTQPGSESEEIMESKSITVEHTSIVEVAGDIPIESTEVDESTSKPSALPETSGPSVGTRLGKLMNKIPGLSRESTPEVEDTQEPSKTPKFTEENFVKAVWYLIRDEDKPENSFENGEGPRTWKSLAKSLEKVKDKLKEDYAKARAG